MTRAERIAEYDPHQRFRIYQVRTWRRVDPTAAEREPEQIWVGCAGSDTLAGLGLMVGEFLAEGEIDPALPVGFLDTAPWETGEPGVWLANPHAARVAV